MFKIYLGHLKKNEIPTNNIPLGLTLSTKPIALSAFTPNHTTKTKSAQVSNNNNGILGSW